MDLRSGCIYWTDRKQNLAPACGPLDRDLETDAVVLGGGITGAMAAHYLVEAGVGVVMLDRRNVAQGSTAASTGLLQYEIDVPLVQLAEKVGQTAAARAYLMGVEALDEFESLIQLLRDDCGFSRRRSLLLATDDRSSDLLRAECEERRRIGIRADFLNSADLKERLGLSRPGGIVSQDAAQIDPYRFTAALVRRALTRGLRAFGQTQVVTYEPDDRGVSLQTSTGHRVRAGHVIFATGYETPEFVEPLPVKLKSTYALATHPIQSDEFWGEDECLIWETGTPYFYARTAGPPGQRRALVGGEDEDFADPHARDALIPQKAQILLQKLHKLFPHLQPEPDCAWAGTFAETTNALPLIGPHPKFPRGLFALGYGGNGITFGLIAARLLRDCVMGKGDTDLWIFRLDRC
jgi:glycine/D-amino acid oxidase-like deaminating enzyme